MTVFYGNLVLSCADKLSVHESQQKKNDTKIIYPKSCVLPAGLEYPAIMGQ